TGCGLPLQRQHRHQRHRALRRAPDVLRRLGRRLERAGGVRQPGGDGRGGVLLRRRDVDPRHRRRRARRGGARPRSRRARRGAALARVSWRARIAVYSAAAGGALALPAAALAHAALLRTTPSASVVTRAAPKQVTLTYSEAVEPRFATVSVTDADAHQQTTAPPQRSPANPDTLVVPLRPLPEGWYLVYWRVVSEDGHPVRGAFTFAVGPNPGPAPQFVIPSISESAATPPLLIARWLTLLAATCAIGLVVLRLAVARPALRAVTGASLRSLAASFSVAIGLALVATPVYVEMSTATFAQRSAFGRGMLDFELVLAFLAVAGGVAIWLDDPRRERRSVAALLSLAGAGAATGGALLVPGLAGHAAVT